MSEHDDFGAFLLGFIVGSLTGAAASLLLAPQSGDQTRSMLKDKAIELGGQVNNTLDDARVKAEEITADARARSEAITSEAKMRADEIVKHAKSTVDELQKRGSVVLEEQKNKISDAVKKPMDNTPVDPQSEI